MTATPPGQRAAADYADEYVMTTDSPDSHTVEEWARAAMEHAHPVVRRVIIVAHQRILRFALTPDDRDGHVLGWHIEQVDANVIVLRTSGPIASAVIVGRRLGPSSLALTSYLWFDRSVARHVWRAVGPLHRRLAPYLLVRAAVTLAAQAGDAVPPRPTSASAAQ